MNAHIPTYALYGQECEAAEPDDLYLESLNRASQRYEGLGGPYRRTDLHQIAWVEEGSVDAILDGKKIILHSPVLISVPPSIHAFDLSPGATGVSLTLSQSYRDMIIQQLEGMADSIKHWSYIIPNHVLDAHKNRVSEIFGQLALEYSSSHTHRRPALYGNTTLLIVEMARLLNLERQQDHDATPKKSRAVFRNFEALIEAHFSDHWKISEYAAALSTNERTLRRICRAIKGLAPTEILQHRIIIEAKRNLLYTDKTVSEICYGLGFADPSHFTKYFINSEGISPTVYRAQKQNQPSLI